MTFPSCFNVKKKSSWKFPSSIPDSDPRQASGIACKGVPRKENGNYEQTSDSCIRNHRCIEQLCLEDL